MKQNPLDSNLEINWNRVIQLVFIRIWTIFDLEREVINLKSFTEAGLEIIDPSLLDSIELCWVLMMKNDWIRVCWTICRKSKAPEVCVDWLTRSRNKNADKSARINNDPLLAPVYLSRKELSSLADLTDDLYQTDDNIKPLGQDMEDDDDEENGDIDVFDDNYEKRQPVLVAAASASNPLSSHSDQELQALMQLHRLQKILSSFKNRPRPYSTDGKHLSNPDQYIFIWPLYHTRCNWISTNLSAKLECDRPIRFTWLRHHWIIINSCFNRLSTQLFIFYY